MSLAVGRLSPTGGTATTVALAFGYVIVSVLVDPLVALDGPSGLVVRPSAGLPVLFAIAFGPVGVVATLAGVAIESLFVGGGLAFSVAKLVGYGGIAWVSWVAWDSPAGTDEPVGRSSLPVSVVLVTVAGATLGNACFGLLARTLGGYPFAPVAVQGALETLVASLVLASVWGLVVRFRPDSVPSQLEVDAPAAALPRRCLGVTAVGVVWIAVATGLDVFLRDFPLIPLTVADQRLPHGLNVLLRDIGTTWWAEVALQLTIAAVALGAVAFLLATGLDVSVDDPVATDE